MGFVKNLILLSTMQKLGKW